MKLTTQVLAAVSSWLAGQPGGERGRLALKGNMRWSGAGWTLGISEKAPHSEFL